jgi:hypothetical protein
MKVIVKTSGFYGGTWYDAKTAPVEMPDRIAKPFLPPYGDQLASPAAAPAAKPADKADDKRDAKKAG